MNTQGFNESGPGVRAQGEKGRGRKERSERGTRDARGARVASQRLSRGDLDLDLKPDVTCSDVGGCKEQIEMLCEVVEALLLSVC